MRTARNVMNRALFEKVICEPSIQAVHLVELDTHAGRHQVSKDAASRDRDEKLDAFVIRRSSVRTSMFLFCFILFRLGLLLPVSIQWMQTTVLNIPSSTPTTSFSLSMDRRRKTIRRCVRTLFAFRLHGREQRKLNAGKDTSVARLDGQLKRPRTTDALCDN